MKDFTVASVNRLATLPGFRALMANNGRLAAGDLEEQRTPFFHEKDPVATLNGGLLAIGGTAFDDLESNELKKCGPFKRSPYEKYKGNLYAYYPEQVGGVEVVVPSAPNRQRMLELAVSDVADYLRTRIRRIAIQTDLDAAYKSARKNTNLGLPYLSNRWTPDIIAEYLGRARRGLGGGKVFYPFTLFHRSQPKGLESWKDRVVWGSDHAETFMGLTVLKPILDVLSDIPEFAAWRGIDAVEEYAAQIFAVKGVLASTDFETFDATVDRMWMEAAVTLINACFGYNLGPRFLGNMITYYTEGEIVTPEGLISGRHGLPSGVTWTNLIGTFVQWLLLAITCRQIGRPLTNMRCMFLGDDGVINFANDEEVRVHFEVARLMGLKVNDAKSSVSEDEFSFLQRHFRKANSTETFCPGVYSGLRTIGRLIWTERGGFKIDDEVLTDSFVKYDAGFWTLVAFMKLENCKRHPKFRELVEYVVRGDKFGLNPELVGGRDKFISSIKGYDTANTTPTNARDRRSVDHGYGPGS